MELSSPYRITSEFLADTADGVSPVRNTYLLILNHRLPKTTAKVWERGTFKICADGGANRLYDDIPKLFPKEDPAAVRRRFMPDMIRGDLDSMRADVASFYTRSAVPIVDLSSDQDTTDLTKCLMHLDATVLGPQADLNNINILALGGVGGRLDHTLANLNTMHTFRHLPLGLWGDGNLVRLVRPGTTIITPHQREGPTCGLIPLTGPARVTTSGLRWNLAGQEMAMTGLVSACNIIDAPTITVETDVDLIWTTELNDWEDGCNLQGKPVTSQDD